MTVAEGGGIFISYRRQEGSHLAGRLYARWSVALALGIRQGEALGLRWAYVNLETGEIRAWFQIQRAEWQHGCDDPHTCGAKWHRTACRKSCKQHQHEPDCKPDCKKRSHRCCKRPCPK